MSDLSMSKFSRRALIGRGSMMAAVAGLATKTEALQGATTGHALQVGPNIYESIGVHPVINCRGTFTIISGSQSLPEVKQAMAEASRHYVHMDELMEGVGARLAELTQAEWGVILNGCAASITNATAACICGTDPEKMQRVPDLTGLKSEVIMPKYSRNVYDHAARMLGVKIVEVNSPEELENAFNPRTAMVLILSSPPAERGPMGIEAISAVAKKHSVPVLVDAAAEDLTIPNIHLQQGATMVAYSGGKCMRGPQSAGLLLGQKDLVKAAWLNSAPHHAFGRSLKCGKEEIMGMLAAVEMWSTRDHKAEWDTWMTWLNHIGESVTKVQGVSLEIIQPADLSNHAPELRIKWDGNALGITGREVEKALLDGRPRIIVGGSRGSWPDNMESSVTIMPYMMMPGDSKIAAEALHNVLAKPPKMERVPYPTGETVNVAGQWAVHIDFLRGSADHMLTLEQSGDALTGTHHTETLTDGLQGKVYANQVRFASMHRIQGTQLRYAFVGTVNGNSMDGTVDMGEYGIVKYSAVRHSA